MQPDIPDIPIREKQTRKLLLRQYSSVATYFFGTIFTTSSTYSLGYSEFNNEDRNKEQKQCENKASFTVRPKAWMVKFGFNYGLYVNLVNSSIQGWKCSLNTFCPVEDDALIFRYCKAGDLAGVRTLFSEGRASVRDTNITYGDTSLHVSLALYSFFDICRL